MLLFGVHQPRTKPLRANTACGVCKISVADLAAWKIGPSPHVGPREPQGRRGGRPRIAFPNYQRFIQPTYFMAGFLTHLRGYNRHSPEGAETHLKENGLSEWIEC